MGNRIILVRPGDKPVVQTSLASTDALGDLLGAPRVMHWQQRLTYGDFGSLLVRLVYSPNVKGTGRGVLGHSNPFAFVKLGYMDMPRSLDDEDLRKCLALCEKYPDRFPSTTEEIQAGKRLEKEGAGDMFLYMSPALAGSVLAAVDGQVARRRLWDSL